MRVKLKIKCLSRFDTNNGDKRNCFVFSEARAGGDEQDVLLPVLRLATFDRDLLATRSGIRARTVDADKDKRREFVERPRGLCQTRAA